MREVAIIGTGITKFQEFWDKSFRRLGIEAGLSAIKDSNITGSDIDALYIGNTSAGQFINQEHIGPLVAEEVGLSSGHIPATRVEGGSAAGGLALAQAWSSIASGMHDIVVVGGAEKMSDLSQPEIIKAEASGADQEWESFFGATMSSLWALMARRHMYEYGTTREQMASVPVKNHSNAVNNPNAQFRFPIKIESVLNSPIESDPLTVLEASPVSDGAAALVLASVDKASEYTSDPVIIKGIGQGTDSLALHDRLSYTTCRATSKAVDGALKMSGYSIENIDIAEVHDAYSISEIMAIEDLGFVEKGEGGKAVEEGWTDIGDRIPVNTSGGLKARGNPLGATGIAQIVEICHQLQSKADKRQVEGARIGLAHNMGGTGGTAVVHVLEVK